MMRRPSAIIKNIGAARIRGDAGKLVSHDEMEYFDNVNLHKKTRLRKLLAQ